MTRQWRRHPLHGFRGHLHSLEARRGHDRRKEIVQSFAGVCKRARKNIARNDLLKNLIRV